MDQHNHMNHESHMDHNHKDHNHSGHDHSHMLIEYKNKFIISMLVTIPILILSPMIQDFLGFELSFIGDSYILFALSTFVFIYGGKPFLLGSVDEVKKRNLGMMTLIALAIIVAYLYSALTIFVLEGSNFFWELATLIDIMLIGHYIEMKSVMSASNALEKLVKLIPSEAHLIVSNGNVKTIRTDEVQKGDKLLIKPGEKIPVDCAILSGESTVDESMLTGESVPVTKKKGDLLIGGAINGSGSLTVQVQKIGKDSYIYQVIDLVKEAQESKSRTQDLSNRAAKLLFYVAVSVGVITFIIWIIIGKDVSYALERMVTVMVIACPHALGLAAPLVVARSTAISAQNGLLIRNRANFEEARNLEAIVFDKTGTLTKGAFIVTDIVLAKGHTEEELLKYAASLESQSSHPLAIGLLKSAKDKNTKIIKPTKFESLTGKGITGIVENNQVHVISPGYMEDEKIKYPVDKYKKLSNEGKTISFVLVNNELIGFYALADEVRESAKSAVKKLKEMNIKTIMLTGDNKQVANWVANQLGLDEVYAEVLPHEKAEIIKELKTRYKKVAMTGDGINDAPALVTADLGIAIGAGTDVAIESADVILVRSDPEDVVSIISLSRSTYRKMKQNLWWAAGYNIVTIPLAAGVLYSIGIVLSPAMGAVLMSLSTVIVAINARLFKG
ncbi:copper-translocating P-type ATPase [Xianfuyuplasma coldseepsis]|uniref:Copper-translocating P-type ATPase n=1 Tax=Candidatus Xianfuyuplasma coldseepsis TaxID=2782163 RepID=A0A7L7KT78_9MOLU|nr:copper-translocating P-type ATPase [Xianfuyuplasma coldseepsis]